EIKRETVRVVARNGGWRNWRRAKVCCGAVHAHGGRHREAVALARQNIDVFKGDAPIVTNVAGCGAMLKGYGELLHGDHRAMEFATRVRDVSEYLAGLPVRPPQSEMHAKATYHDPCHLCHAQGIRRQPRDLIKIIRGVELTELPESEVCCGAAGTYNLTQPELSKRLAARKLECIARTGADTVVTGNAGCILQLRAAAKQLGRELGVIHPV